MSDIASLDGTALTAGQYLDHLHRDAGRLLASAPLDAPVPSCPGWTVADLLDHVAGVYEHKVVAVRTAARPEEDGLPAPGADPYERLRTQYEALTAELAAHGPDDPSWTWWPPEQNVGFWHRRMAQESAVHRWDAEQAAGQVSPIPDDLAVDGIDEILGWLAWPFDPAPTPLDGRMVVLRAGGHAWAVTLRPGAYEPVGASSAAPTADASVTGDPEAMLLWLWGRAPDDALAIGGDPAALGQLRTRLAMLAD